jgi:hypothetical protein
MQINAPSAAIWLPGVVWVGLGVSAFVTTLNVVSGGLRNISQRGVRMMIPD